MRERIKMEIKNKRVKKHINKFLINSVDDGIFPDLTTAVSKFYGWTDKIKAMYEANDILANHVLVGDEIPVKLGDYLWYPQAGIYKYEENGEKK